MKLYRIELEDEKGIKVHYKYGADEADALKQALSQEMQLDIRVRHVKRAGMGDMLDACRTYSVK